MVKISEILKSYIEANLFAKRYLDAWKEKVAYPFNEHLQVKFPWPLFHSNP